MEQKKYRALTRDAGKQEYRWVYGMPSYGYETEEIAEIGTPYGDFYDIIPSTLGKQTGYSDRHGKTMYTGDIATMEVDGKLREFEVVEITAVREYNTLPGFGEKTARVRISGVIAFRWRTPEGKVFDLLPCVDEAGADDTSRMEIIDTVHERAVHGSESGGKKQ